MAHTLPEGGENGIVQLNLFGSQDRKLAEWLLGLDITSITPLEALTELNELKEYVRKNS